MAVAPAGGRATLDFFGAQAEARRKTAVLVVSFALAVCAVVAMVYAALLVVVTTTVPRVENRTPVPDVEVTVFVPGWQPPIQLFQPVLLLAAAAGVAAVTGLGAAWHAARLSAGGGEAVAAMLGGVPLDRGSAEPGESRLVNV